MLGRRPSPAQSDRRDRRRPRGRGNHASVEIAHVVPKPGLMWDQPCAFGFFASCHVCTYVGHRELAVQVHVLLCNSRGLKYNSKTCETLPHEIQMKITTRYWKGWENLHLPQLQRKLAAWSMRKQQQPVCGPTIIYSCAAPVPTCGLLVPSRG